MTLVIFNASGRVVQALLNGGFSQPDFAGRSDCDFNANLSTVLGQPTNTWIRDAGTWRLESAGEQTARLAAESAAMLAEKKIRAKAVFNDAQEQALRVLCDILKDEFNIVRGWTVSFKAEVAASTSLANLQTRVATLPTLNDRTLDQLKTAFDNRVDAGTVN